MTRTAATLGILGYVIVAGSARVAAAQTKTSQRAMGDSAVSAVPRYRLRVLGVYDETTGSPIEGVSVLSLFNGLSAATTRTGTVSLVYVPEGMNLLRLQKLGYAPLTLPVSISPKDTTPLTVTMQPVAELGTVVTRAPGTQYTSPNLSGFDERMKSHMGGYFLGDSLLRANESEQLANLMRSRTPGALFLEVNVGGDHMFLPSENCAWLCLVNAECPGT